VDDEFSAQLRLGNAKLKPQDRKLGDKIWIIEIIAPFGGREEILQDLESQFFTNQNMYFCRQTVI